MFKDGRQRRFRGIIKTAQSLSDRHSTLGRHRTAKQGDLGRKLRGNNKRFKSKRSLDRIMEFIESDNNCTVWIVSGVEGEFI